VLVLALDTATSATTVAVVAEGQTLAEHTDVAPNRHGEVLAPLIARTLSDAGVARSQLDLVAAGVGPGPFTGLRVGLATALALGDALGVPARGVCSLDVVAAHAGRPWADGFTVLTDARRKEVYWASYLDGRRTRGPAVERPDALAARLGATTLVGAGAVLYEQVFPDARVDPRSPFPSAAVLAELAADERWVVPVQPLYLRRPDARPPGAPKRVTPA